MTARIYLSQNTLLAHKYITLPTAHIKKKTNVINHRIDTPLLARVFF